MSQRSYNEIQQQIDRQMAEINAINLEAERAEQVAEHASRSSEESIFTKIINTLNRMKKLLFITLALVAFVTGAWAQDHWTTVSHAGEGASQYTPVYATLNLGSATNIDYQNYVVAAFVGDEELPRVYQSGSEQAYPASTAAADYNYFVLNIPGNFDSAAESDNGKTITFKLYNTSSGLEYNLTTSTAITFDGAQHGTTSALVELSCTEVKGIQPTSDIHMNWNDEVNVKGYVKTYPTGATVPNNLEYVFSINSSNQSYLSLSADNILTSNEAAVADGVRRYCSSGVIVDLGSLYTSINVYIHNHVTNIDINEGFETITVNVGDADDLKAKLEAAFAVTPANTTDERSFTSGNSSIVSISTDAAGTSGEMVFNPLAIGETTVTVSYKWTRYGQPQSYTYTTATKTVNVKVVQPVTDITLSSEAIECNVGDDLTSYIKSLINVQPEEATDKNVTFELGPNSEQGIVTIENNTITANAAGTADIVIKSVSNPEVQANLSVTVHQWATAFASIGQPTRYYSYTDESINITSDFIGTNGCIKTTPEGAEVYSLTATSSDATVVRVLRRQGTNNWVITVLKAGEATLTFKLTYPDYINGGTKSATTEVEIIVSQDVASFSLDPSSIRMNVDDEIDLTSFVKLEPEGVNISSEDFIWTLAEESHSQYLQINGNTLKALAPNIEVQYSSLRLTLRDREALGSKNLIVYVYQPATSITVNTPTITVNKGDWEALRDALAAAVTINPDNHTDNVEWESANTEIIDYQEVADGETTTQAWVPLNGGQTTMTVRASGYGGEHQTATITVNVNVPVESITFPTFTAPKVNVGDDLTDYLNSIITVLPEDATNKSFHYVISMGLSRAKVENGRVITIAAGAMGVKAVADDGSGVESNQRSFVSHIQAKDVNFSGDITVKYTGNDIDISDLVKNNISFDPESPSYITISTTSSNENIATVSVTPSSPQINGSPATLTVIATAKSLGETTVSMAVTYIDLLAELMDASGGQHRTTVTRTFKIIVSEGLTDFLIDYPKEIAVGGSYKITITPQPVEAIDNVDLDYFTDEFYNELIEGSLYSAATGGPEMEDGKIVYTVEPLLPGELLFQISYDDGDFSWHSPAELGSSFNIGVPTTLSEGWQWKTLWGPIGSADDFVAHMGDGSDDRFVSEVRSQAGLMANDPTYGYFGDLYDNGLQPNVAYKIKASKAVGIDEAGIQWGGEMLTKTMPQALKKAWTWIPYPYYDEYTIGAIFTAAGYTPANGDKLVSKEDGFVEYSNGSWSGSLGKMLPWQAYLYYNNKGEAATFNWPTEEAAQNAQYSGARSTQQVRRVNTQRTWQYDPHPFADNMSIVAQLDGVADQSRFSVGAFVDGECRGEGVCNSGRIYITVHANQGERITFRLYDELTGEMYDVDQTVTASLMLGSIAQPFHMSSQSFATGIEGVMHNEECIMHNYDLSGRAVDGSRKGVHLQKQPNGTVKKVVVK